MRSTERDPISDETRNWYDAYYRTKGRDRNDLLTNPEVLFQHLAFEAGFLTALREASRLDRATSRVLDVGCGGGASLAWLLGIGFKPENLRGIDIIAERVEAARKKYPGIEFECRDAASMPYETGEFDLVLESTMFVQLTDESLAREIAREMLRVTRPGGYLLLMDWRYGKPGSRNYLAVSKHRIGSLFSVGTLTDVVCRKKGALIPPVGRAVSRFVPALYFLVRALLPFLVGSQATLLHKRSA